MPFDTPDDKFLHPVSGGNPPSHDDRSQGDASSGSDDRFAPQPLDPSKLRAMQSALARNEERRQQYHAGPLRIYVDGTEQVSGDLPPNGTLRFNAPAHASYVEVVGSDAEGDLTLAVFPVPYFPVPYEEVEEDESLDETQLSVQLDDGRTLTLTIQPPTADLTITHNFRALRERPTRGR